MVKYAFKFMLKKSNSTKYLKGKTALVTGASMGFGIRERFSQEGQIAEAFLPLAGHLAKKMGQNIRSQIGLAGGIEDEES